ncbi:hypothetical protein WR25_09638 [Diploscapter pachys]|uniref:Uncharacterized protein n=1 Tax=Diploscapter pachys TaxID=2018661 RepID=A0A2A2J4V2_9BILA|nr:hypothetical protein WR25_09638 [Diploscapter pachys]
MLISLPEFISWTGFTVFEIWLHSVALLIGTILLALKYSNLIALSYWLIFTPSFIACALNAYFLFIVYIRTAVEFKSYKDPFISYSYNWFRVAMLVLFEVILCYKIDGDLEQEKVAVQSPYGVIFMPLWLFMASLFVQSCRLF